MRNAEVSVHFDEVKDWYALHGTITYRVLAYRNGAEEERLRMIPCCGPKAEETVLVALDAGLDDRTKPRLLLSRARALAESLADALREHPAADRVEIAGSARRWNDVCSDLDLVA